MDNVLDLSHFDVNVYISVYVSQFCVITCKYLSENKQINKLYSS